MRPTEVLSQEHRVILAVLACISAATEACASGAEVCTKTFRQGIDFLRGYADESHEQKEEEDFFPMLEERGIARDGGPIGVMMAEHARGRELISELERVIEEVERDEPTGRDALIGQVAVVVSFLKSHLEKEDAVLFPLADSVLEPQDEEDLLAAFETADLGGGIINQFLAVARELCERWGVPFPEGSDTVTT